MTNITPDIQGNSLSESADEIQSPEAPQNKDAPSKSKTPSKSKRSWKKYVIYFFAFLGILALGIVALAVYVGFTKPVKASINEVETIDLLMTRNYGKYSEQHKGWLFVGNGNRTFVMRVVQQAKPEDGPAGDELYFVASGTPLDGGSGTLYGVFQVRLKDGSKDDTQIEVSDPFRYDGDVPVTPEQVKFEAFSANVWGWVIKVQDGTDPKSAPVIVRNVVLAPHGEDIAELATFTASKVSDPGVSCDEANRLYELWLNPPAVSAVAAMDETKDKAAAKVDDDTDGESEGPLRCNNVKWSFRTGAISGQAFTPLTVTRKGVLDGKKEEDKSWKLIFDNKSYVYIVPSELQMQ